MNKLALTAALLPMMALALTGCKEDTQPRLQEPVAGSFELYEPAMNNYTYELSPLGTITLTTSGQPDYGLGTPTQYQVQVSLTGEWKEAEDPENPGVMIPDTYYCLKTVNTQSVINVKDSELATAMCSLMGINDIEDENLFSAEPRPVHVRVAAYVADPAAENGYVDYSYILSNPITLKSVIPYFVVPKPGELYLIGDYQGWKIEGNEQTAVLTETEIGSQVYQGYVEMTKEQAGNGFRAYNALGDWGSDGSLPSIGAAADDGDNQDVELTDDVYEGECVKGKGNWKITNFPGGWMKVTINMMDMIVTFQYDPNYEPPTAE